MARFLSCFALIAVVVLMYASPANAQCPSSQVFGHQLGGVITGCDDTGQVAGFVYALGTTAYIDSATQVPPPALTGDFICEADGEASQGFGTCVGGAGIRGDKIITIDGNWANAGPCTTQTGLACPPPPATPGACPNPGGSAAIGRNIMIVRDNAGGTVVLSVGYSTDFAGYVAEFADKASGTPPTTCHSGGTPTNPAATSRSVNFTGITSSSTNPATGDKTVTFTATPVVPFIFSDCTADSVGAGTTCLEGAPIVAAGSLYTRIGPCDITRVPFTRTLWTLSTGQAVIPRGQCLFIGASLIMGGAEGSGIVGAVSVPGDQAASPRALDARAKRSGGDITVSWRTDTEVGLIGFVLETKSGRQIGGMIAPKGSGGAGSAYSVALRRGDLKNDRSLYVVSVTTDARLKSDLVRF